MSKTPNVNMARPLERFRDIFKKLNIGEAYILPLEEKEYKLSQNVSTLNVYNF